MAFKARNQIHTPFTYILIYASLLKDGHEVMDVGLGALKVLVILLRNGFYRQRVFIDSVLF